MKRMFWGLAGVAAVAVAAAALLMVPFEPAGPPTTDTTSREIAALEDRRAFLDEYLGPMPYADLEDGTPPDSALSFSVVYRNNNSGFVPGPSDWTMQVLARVPPDSFGVWRRDLAPADSLDTSWLETLRPGPRVDGLGEWFGGPFRMVGLDREHGVVAYRASTM